MFGLLKKKSLPFDVIPFSGGTIAPSKMLKEPIGTAFACINYKAKFFGSLKDETLIGEDVRDTFLTPLMKRSNANMSWEQLKSLAMFYLYSTGNAYIYAPKSQNRNTPSKLMLLPSSKIKPKTQTDIIEYYEFNSGSHILNIDPSEMIHIKRLFPSTDFAKSFYLGQAKELEQALALMKIEMSSVEFVQTFFDADGVTPYILSAKEMIPPDVLKKQKTSFNESILNNRYHVQAMIGAGMKVESLAKSSKADGIASQEISNITERICRLFGVPKELLNMEFAGKATVDSVIQFFYDISLANDVRNFEQTITAWGLQYQDDFSYNIQDYKIDNSAELRLQEISDLENGFRTINEILQDRGLEPVANGDLRLIKQGLYPLSDLAYTPQLTTPAPAGEKKKTIKELIGSRP